MRFIHTADLHLDSPFLGLTSMPKSLWERVHSSTFAAFQKIVDDAIALTPVLYKNSTRARSRSSVQFTRSASSSSAE